MRKQSHEALGHVTLSARAQKILAQDVRQRRHIEACGLLIGQIDTQGNWEVEHVQPLRNIFNSPVYFEFAPEDLLTAELDYPDHIIGVYHSHPTGFARASNTDRENMQRVNVEENILWIWLIVSGPFDERFAITDKGSVAGTSIVAYHHYEKTGLMKIAIRFDDGVEKAGE
ncbi:MAG TPA: Mov34/MPN/PAD-1 family protein [Ktedonobacteraceae bacterium]|nr:Mov34/MPN/PAD-1 family protein [Ktedonobacteraceae bacterium]